MRYGIRAVPTSFKVFKRPMYLVFLVGTMARIPCRYLLYIRYWHDFRCTTKWAAVSCYLCDDDKGGRNAAWFRWENLFPQPIDLATLFSQTEVLRISGPIAIARIFWEPQAQWSRLHLLQSCSPGFDPQAQHLCFFNLNCDEKRMKINKKRPGLAHLKKESLDQWSWTCRCYCPIRRVQIPDQGKYFNFSLNTKASPF